MESAGTSPKAASSETMGVYRQEVRRLRTLPGAEALSGRGGTSAKMCVFTRPWWALRMPHSARFAGTCDVPLLEASEM